MIGFSSVRICYFFNFFCTNFPLCSLDVGLRSLTWEYSIINKIEFLFIFPSLILYVTDQRAPCNPKDDLMFNAHQWCTIHSFTRHRVPDLNVYTYQKSVHCENHVLLSQEIVNYFTEEKNTYFCDHFFFFFLSLLFILILFNSTTWMVNKNYYRSFYLLAGFNKHDTWIA